MILLGLLLSSSIAGSSVIYDELNDIIYIGGFEIDNLRYVFEKIEYQYKEKIYVLDAKNNTTRSLINTEERIFADEISAKGYIAVSTSTKEQGGKRYVNKLIIYKSDGEKLKVIDDVLSKGINNYFSWSVDGAKIVYVKGDDIIEGGIQPKGVWIYDLDKDREIMISKWGAEVYWSKYDNNIYIQNEFKADNPSNISVYNLTTDKLTKSDKHGIYLSDDGKYYIGYSKPAGYESGFTRNVFETATNKKAFDWPEGMLTQLKFITNTHYLLTWTSHGGYKVFDVDKARVIRKVEKAGVVGWNKDMTKLVVYDGGNQVHIDDLLTGKRLRSLDIPK